MSEEFKDSGQGTQDGGWTRGDSGQMGTTQDSGWTSSGVDEMGAFQENAGAQDFYASQDATASMGADAQGSAFAQKPVNIVTGIVGAFLGILIGVVLWVIVYQLGYIAGIAGFVMMICAFKGFELLGGRINIPGAVICIIMVLVAVYFAHNISIAFSVMTEVEGYSFSMAYRYIPALRKVSSEFNSAYFHDLIIGYVLTVIAIVPSIKNVIMGSRS